RAQRHAAVLAGVGDRERGRVQRADHRAADPAGPARRALPAGLGVRPAATQPAHLRRRWADRAVRRHQAARPGDLADPRALRKKSNLALREGKVALLYQLWRQSWAGLRLMVAATLVLGLAYPLVVYGFGRVAAPWQARGSLVTADGGHTEDPGKAVGSKLIGQLVDSDSLFQPRPSAAGD